MCAAGAPHGSSLGLDRANDLLVVRAVIIEEPVYFPTLQISSRGNLQLEVFMSRVALEVVTHQAREALYSLVNRYRVVEIWMVDIHPDVAPVFRPNSFEALQECDLCFLSRLGERLLLNLRDALPRFYLQTNIRRMKS